MEKKNARWWWERNKKFSFYRLSAQFSSGISIMAHWLRSLYLNVIIFFKEREKNHCVFLLMKMKNSCQKLEPTESSLVLLYLSIRLCVFFIGLLLLLCIISYIYCVWFLFGAERIWLMQSTFMRSRFKHTERDELLLAASNKNYKYHWKIKRKRISHAVRLTVTARNQIQLKHVFIFRSIGK